MPVWVRPPLVLLQLAKVRLERTPWGCELRLMMRMIHMLQMHAQLQRKGSFQGTDNCLTCVSCAFDAWTGPMLLATDLCRCNLLLEWNEWYVCTVAGFLEPSKQKAKAWTQRHLLQWREQEQPSYSRVYLNHEAKTFEIEHISGNLIYPANSMLRATSTI